MRRLTLYVRPGCHLCAEARAVLTRHPVRVDLVDIEQDDDLHRRYLERIPVGVLDGEWLFDFVVDEAELERRLAPTG